MSDDLRTQIYNNLALRDTETLVEIWRINDRVEWSETTFDVLCEILEKRLDTLPTQNPPITEHISKNPAEDIKFPFKKLADPENTPEFYKPKAILWVSAWLYRISTPAIVIIILTNILEFRKLQLTILSYFMGDPQWNLLSWLLAFVIGGLAIALQCAITFFALRALANVLTMLMEMEYSSRGIK